MFNDSKYTKWYYQLMTKADSRLIRKTKGHHIHHIIPSSLGGSDESANKVLLTHDEHFIAHLLLMKMTSGKDRSKMAFALKRFGGKNNRRSFVLASNLISEALTGSGNPMFGKHLSEEHKAKISGKNHGMYGKYCYEVWIEKYGKDVAYNLDLQMRNKRSKSLSGNGNPMHGIPRTIEQKIHQSKLLSGENHFNFGKPAFTKGRVWINDGTKSRMVSEDTILERGWKKGRLPK